MRMKKLVSPIDGRVIEVEKLNRWQLRDIHFQEESKIAKRLKELAPFSEERKILMNEGCSFIHELHLAYRNIASLGADENSVKILKAIVEERLKKTDKEIVVYEAGVGLGYAIRKVIDNPKVIYRGCDVDLNEKVIALSQKYTNLILNETTLYEDLCQLEDESIDVFYADNVIEHLFPDEAEVIFKVLYEKMKRNGNIFLIIPNRNFGPSDVSMYYLPKGKKAEGFHFMETTYSETVNKFWKVGFKPTFIFKNGRFEKDPLYFKNICRMLVEAFINSFLCAEAGMELLAGNSFTLYYFTKRRKWRR